MLEVCILTVGQSRSRAHASYPSCVTAYPRGSRSRVFTVLRQRLSAPAPGSAARCARCRKSDQPLQENTSRRSLLILISYVQPIQCFPFFAEPQIDHSERCRTDVLAFCHLFEFAQHLLGFRSISGNGISVPEESLIPCAGNHRFRFLKFCDCARRVAFPQKAAA